MSEVEPRSHTGIQLPLVETAVAVVVHRDRINRTNPTQTPLLTVYNPRWGGFTLPMSKRQKWPGCPACPGEQIETWESAAARAQAEWTGQTCVPVELATAEVIQWAERDGGWKEYHFRIYGVIATVEPLPGTITEWLTLDELATRLPISLTVFQILDALKGKTLLTGGDRWP